MADSTEKKERDTNKINILMDAITFYTSQLEDYDKSNFTACMSCIGFVGAIVAVIGAILSSASSTSAGPISDLLINRVVPTLLLVVPAIITLFLYNFSMNCRRSAIFEGYVQFLEEQLNKEMGQEIMLYANFLVPKKYATYKVNKYGWIAMASTVGIIFALCLGCAYYFMCYNSALPCDLYVFACAVLAIACVGWSICYIISLAHNNVAMMEVKTACKDKFSM